MRRIWRPSRLFWVILGVVVASGACLRDREGSDDPHPGMKGESTESRATFALPPIFTLDASAPMDQVGFAAVAPGETVPSLFTSHDDGNRVRRITFAPGGAFEPSVLPDGRLLFRAGGATSGTLNSIWFTVRTDGTDLAAARPADIMSAKCARGTGGVHPNPPGSSSVVRDDRRTGELYCLDSRISDQPTDRVIRRVRVFGMGTGKTESSPSPNERETIGEATVEADGSFFLELPAKTPFQLATIDEGGQVMRSMDTWMWVMPGERRGCIGCHEDRDRTPPNRHVLALRKSPQRIGTIPAGLPNTDTDEDAGP